MIVDCAWLVGLLRRLKLEAQSQHSSSSTKGLVLWGRTWCFLTTTKRQLSKKLVPDTTYRTTLVPGTTPWLGWKRFRFDEGFDKPRILRAQSDFPLKPHLNDESV